MKVFFRIAVLAAVVATVAACARATTATSTSAPTTDFRTPLGAVLTSSATTGAPVPLRVDPNAKVIISTAANLPAAAYLATQADRGAQVYAASCGMCHAGGELVGERFVAAWKDRRVYDLYALVRSTMPLDNPGGLKDGEYLDVVAYLLQANGHSGARTDSLRADTTTLRKTKIAVGAP